MVLSDSHIRYINRSVASYGCHVNHFCGIGSRRRTRDCRTRCRHTHDGSYDGSVYDGSVQWEIWSAVVFFVLYASNV